MEETLPYLMFPESYDLHSFKCYSIKQAYFKVVTQYPCCLCLSWSQSHSCICVGFKSEENGAFTIKPTCIKLLLLWLKKKKEEKNYLLCLLVDCLCSLSCVEKKLKGCYNLTQFNVLTLRDSWKFGISVLIYLDLSIHIAWI